MNEMNEIIKFLKANPEMVAKAVIAETIACYKELNNEPHTGKTST